MILAPRPVDTAPPEPLSASVTVALTPTDREHLRVAAKAAGTSSSTLGRRAIVAYLKES